MFKNALFFINSDESLAFQHSYKELLVQTKNDHGYLNDDEPPAGETTAAPGEKTTTVSSGTTTTTSRSSLSVTPNVFFSLASLLPVLICKYA